MAGDWLKIEKVTPDKPEVHELARLLEISPDEVFGKLFRVWSWFDDHTTDGNAKCNGVGVTLSLVDRCANANGFASALISVGWLREKNGAVFIPNFDRHNGESAKNRALSAKRVAKHRKRKSNADVTVGALAREEKRREEDNTPCSPPMVEPRKPRRKKPTHQLPEGEFPLELESAVRDWLEYHKPYKPVGFKHLLARIRARRDELGVASVVAAISTAIANGWQGWDHDSAFGLNGKAKKPEPLFDEKGNPADRPVWEWTEEEKRNIRF